ncbi:MAG: hypothetical protein WCO06_04200 [Candidatus Roizmanbacteria bacterium]
MNVDQNKKNKNHKITIISITICVLLYLLLYFIHPLSANSFPNVKNPDNYVVYWVTNPSAIELILRAFYGMKDNAYCDYDLLGWSDNNMLYYTKQCGIIRWSHKMAYDLKTKSNWNTWGNIPSKLTTVSKNNSAKQVTLTDSQGNINTYNTFPVTQISQKDDWYAIKQYYFFGTDDIYIIQRRK